MLTRTLFWKTIVGERVEVYDKRLLAAASAFSPLQGFLSPDTLTFLALMWPASFTSFIQNRSKTITTKTTIAPIIAAEINFSTF